MCVAGLSTHNMCVPPQDACLPSSRSFFCMYHIGSEQSEHFDFASTCILLTTFVQIVKMFGAVIAIFAICWLPYHLYFMYSFFNPSIMKAWYTPHMFLAFYWLAMTNCCVNPMVYYAMNKKLESDEESTTTDILTFQIPGLLQASSLLFIPIPRNTWTLADKHKKIIFCLL